MTCWMMRPQMRTTMLQQGLSRPRADLSAGNAARCFGRISDVPPTRARQFWVAWENVVLDAKPGPLPRGELSLLLSAGFAGPAQPPEPSTCTFVDTRKTLRIVSARWTGSVAWGSPP